MLERSASSLSTTNHSLDKNSLKGFGSEQPNLPILFQHPKGQLRRKGLRKSDRNSVGQVAPQSKRKIVPSPGFERDRLCKRSDSRWAFWKQKPPHWREGFEEEGKTLESRLGSESAKVLAVASMQKEKSEQRARESLPQERKSKMTLC
jgi:hypothetical protein